MRLWCIKILAKNQDFQLLRERQQIVKIVKSENMILNFFLKEFNGFHPIEHLPNGFYLIECLGLI